MDIVYRDLKKLRTFLPYKTQVFFSKIFSFLKLEQQYTYLSYLKLQYEGGISKNF